MEQMQLREPRAVESQRRLPHTQYPAYLTRGAIFDILYNYRCDSIAIIDAGYIRRL